MHISWQVQICDSQIVLSLNTIEACLYLIEMVVITVDVSNNDFMSHYIDYKSWHVDIGENLTKEKHEFKIDL